MQDCGKPYYTSNYLAFFYAIKERHPDMQLIANCNMGEDAPTELWDWSALCSQSFESMLLSAWPFEVSKAAFTMVASLRILMPPVLATLPCLRHILRSCQESSSVTKQNSDLDRLTTSGKRMSCN